MTGRKVRNMEEFASLSGLSRPTLSKFFNNPQSVRPSTRERIKAALDRYDYTPNIYAINQNRRLTRNIGIVVPYLADPFFAEVARKLEPLCAASGFNPILLSSHGDPDREIENLDSLRSIKPAGVLLAPLGRRTRQADLEAFWKGIPTVLFDCEIEGVGDAFFGSDNSQSIGLLVDYLCRTGEAPAFFEMANAPNPNANKRRVAYEEAMQSQGYDPMILSVPGDGWEFEKVGFEEGGRLIRARALPSDTVLCSNDRLAIGMLAAAYESGIRVGIGEGHALRVAGHDDHPYARFTCPSLTTASQDYGAIAGQSLSRLLSIIEAGSRPDDYKAELFDGSLVMRNSA
ncbi:MAG: LacI family DNA-binding transcriptional regulator [Pseudomonadota bacterium]